jgi:hypothetical protein
MQRNISTRRGTHCAVRLPATVAITTNAAHLEHGPPLVVDGERCSCSAPHLALSKGPRSQNLHSFAAPDRHFCHERCASERTYACFLELPAPPEDSEVR